MTKETFTIDVHSFCELTYEVEAENESEAHDKAKEVLSDTDIGDFEIWRVEEVKKDKDEKTINDNN